MQRIGKAAYRLNLAGGHNRQALHGIHDVFHVSLLRLHHDNGLGINVLPIEIDVEVEFEDTEAKTNERRKPVPCQMVEF